MIDLLRGDSQLVAIVDALKDPPRWRSLSRRANAGTERAGRNAEVGAERNAANRPDRHPARVACGIELHCE